MPDRQLIFVAGPYSGETAEAITGNVIEAMYAGNRIFALGHLPYVPHLSHYSDQLARIHGQDIEYEQYVRLTLAMVERCDALLYIGPSPGAERELLRAASLGKTIYRSLDQIPPYRG